MKAIYWIGGGILLLYLYERSRASTIMQVHPSTPYGSVPGSNVPASLVQKVTPPRQASGVVPVANNNASGVQTTGNIIPYPRTRMFLQNQKRRLPNGNLFRIGGREGLERSPVTA